MVRLDTGTVARELSPVFGVSITLAGSKERVGAFGNAGETVPDRLTPPVKLLRLSRARMALAVDPAENDSGNGENSSKEKSGRGFGRNRRTNTCSVTRFANPSESTMVRVTVNRDPGPLLLFTGVPPLPPVNMVDAFAP